MNRKGLMILLVLMVCLLPFAALGMESQAQPLPLEAYQAEQPNDDPTQPYVLMKPYESQVYRLYFEDTQSSGWQYSFYFEEINGVPFTITALHETVYNPVGQVVPFQVTDDPYFFEHMRLENGVGQELGMRFDGGDLGWAAYRLDGVDDNGQEYSFHCLFEFLQEEKPAKTPEEFTVEQQPENGKPFVRLYTEPDPVYAVPREENQQAEYWWEYLMVFENTGSSALTAETFSETGFNGQAVMYDSDYQAEDVITWCDEPDCVLEAGERWVIDCAMPVQELTMVGMRLNGTDESGVEMSFVGTIMLTPEIAP